MIYKLLIFLMIAATCIGLAAWDLTQTPEPKAKPVEKKEETPVAAIIPDAQFVTLDGKAHALHDFKNQVILLNFWATWCLPCIKEFPLLLELAGQRPNIILIALSVDARSDDITTFLDRLPPETKNKVKQANILIGQDQNKHISQDLFQTILYPETFIIGPDLKIKKKIAGVADWTGADIIALIDSMSPP